MLPGRLLKGTLPLLILSVLSEEELYGFQIAQLIRERSGERFTASEGALYPALHRLEADGALDATWRESDRGPRRRYYKITARGNALLREHAAEWSAVSVGVNAVVTGGSQ
jgi:DNA-binding PadR family transcriptional regulator